MKRGQEVYIIVKGTVIKCVVIGREQETNTIIMRYKKGYLTKVYKRPFGQVATGIERGINGIQGSSKCCSDESHRRCNEENSGVRKLSVPIKNGESESNKVFVGAWRTRNMA